MRGAPIPPTPARVDLNTGAGAASASSSGGGPSHPPSFPSSESITRPPAAQTSSSSQISLGKTDKEVGVLSSIEKYFATFVGPMASIIVQRTASKARDREELFALLAATLPSDKDRRLFLTRKDEFFAGPAPIQSAKATSTGESEVQPPPAPHSAELTPAAIRHASELLARYLGPVSRVLTERAVQRADSLRDVYLILAEHLKDRNERARFLREAGFPES